jgi:hypothetical protein
MNSQNIFAIGCKHTSQMETYTSNYNFQKFFALLFGLGFLSFSIFGLIRPDIMTTTDNGNEVETTFLVIFAGLVIGSSSLALLELTQKRLWLQRAKHCRFVLRC